MDTLSAQEVIKFLKLEPLEPEGGYFHRSYEHAESTKTPRGDRPLSSAIYYLLKQGQLSAFHKLSSDETFHFYSGDPVTMTTIDTKGNLSEHPLGANLAAGEIPQFVVPANYWQALQATESKVGWSLLGTTVTPGFHFDDFEIATREELVIEFPQHSDFILKLAHRL